MFYTKFKIVIYWRLHYWENQSTIFKVLLLFTIMRFFIQANLKDFQF